ncbi:hypothetical protein K491DRAFT_702080 [Lophiostoma macrostomum CBS 122681]|uniref:Uncharacterized protein n=1 Tax=Lophiostoma macrostomum CBS 122681 TaxID=1314788 RepID=A0A6A6TK31_9PLEO|nr:hypothetical protein K491DRAFT_702080 [Lophiostoma macrostomum CBS 122681]
MTPAQIAGLSVAAAATFILAIGLMALSVYLRKRRERKSVMTTSEKGMQSPSPSPKLELQGNTLYTHPSLTRAESNNNRHPMQSNTRTSNGNGNRLSLIHPLLRPVAATSRNSSSTSVPLDQIGVAISAEEPGSGSAFQILKPPAKARTATTTAQFLQPPPKPRARQQRPRSLRSSLYDSRPGSAGSALTQDTVFEEDIVSARRRSSKLLPTPAIPIPPIRSFQPSRPPPPAISTRGLPTRPAPDRDQGPRQSGLSLSIPIRHSRSQPARIPVIDTSPPTPSEPAAFPAPPRGPVQQVPTASDSRSRSTSMSGSDQAEDIPDYYFSAYKTSPQYPAINVSPSRAIKPKNSPKVIDIKPKASFSTVSRATSKASSNPRDSIYSQTSFETVDANDPTPEDDDDDKQLSDDNKLSPVMESPISGLRYPKVPRASNQLVPRSPRSPLSQRNSVSPRDLTSPSSLLAKRRGEKEALQFGGQLRLGSPSRADMNRAPVRRQHMRSTSMETFSLTPSAATSLRASRVQSGQWRKSPAMYDPDVVQPLRISKQHQTPAHIAQQSQPVDMNGLKSPAWVPRLTPTRQGDDLFISVSYSQPTYSQPDMRSPMFF